MYKRVIIGINGILLLVNFDPIYAKRGRRSRDRMVVGVKTIYTISAYHHQSCEYEAHSWRGVLDPTLCDKVCQSLVAVGFSQAIKLTSMILLKSCYKISGVKHHNSGPNPAYLSTPKSLIILDNTFFILLSQLSCRHKNCHILLMY